jgi:hypothetical protein
MKESARKGVAKDLKGIGRFRDILLFMCMSSLTVQGESNLARENAIRFLTDPKYG